MRPRLTDIAILVGALLPWGIPRNAPVAPRASAAAPARITLDTPSSPDAARREGKRAPPTIVVPNTP